MPPVGFEPTISLGERPQTYALDRAATGTGYNYIKCIKSRCVYSDIDTVVKIVLAHSCLKYIDMPLFIVLVRYTHRNVYCRGF